MTFDIRELHNHVIKPGIYFNMPNEVYHADLSLSNSGMGNLLKTPKHYWHASNMNPDKEPLDTLALKQGRVLHTLLLEPEKFREEWQIKKDVKTSKVAGMIGEGDYNNLSAAVKSLRSDNVISKLFQYGYPEVSIFWIDQETGVPCRIRMDYLSAYLATDLKSTTDVSNYSLGYSITDYGYYRQAAFYLHGISVIKNLIKDGKAIVSGTPDDLWFVKFLDSVHEKFAFVWQEKTPPYVTRADEFCANTLELGYASFRRALHEFKANYEAYGNFSWPSGYEEKIGIIQLDDLPNKINYALA